MSEGETQYNIPVSSKQLIVYFVFLVIALTAAFLAGVMVGRSVDSSPEPVVRDIQDGLPEEPAPSPVADELTYGSSLQSDRIEGLSTPQAGPSPALKATPRATPAARATPSPAASSAQAPRATPAATPREKPVATPAAPRPKPTPAKSPGKATPAAKGKPTPISRLTIQVGAFKDRAAAESIVKRLKAKGYSAYLVPVSEGLFNVRVGSFTEREDAERILSRLETQEKFKPFIVKP